MDEVPDSPETYMGGMFAPPAAKPEEWMGGIFAPPKDDQVRVEENERLKQQTVQDISTDEIQKHTKAFTEDGKITQPDLAGRLAREAPWLKPDERQLAQSQFESALPSLRKQAQFERSYNNAKAEREAARQTPEYEKDQRGIYVLKRYPLAGSLLGLATAGVKYQAAKKMEAGTDTETDRRTVAHMVLDQQEEQAKNPTLADKILDTASYLPAFLTEWSMLGGLGGVTRKASAELVGSLAKKAGSDFVANAAAKATAGQALTLAERAALQGIGGTAEGIARTAARPDVLATKTLQGVTPQIGPDREVEPGKPVGHAASEALRSQLIENIVFSVGGPFEAKSGESLLPRILKGTLQGVGSAETSQELQYWAANAPQGSAIHRIATAKTPEERQAAVTDLTAQVAAFGGMEGVMHGIERAKELRAEAKKKGEKISPEKLKESLSEVAALPGTKVFLGDEKVSPVPVQQEKAEAVPAPAPTEAAKTPEVAPPVATETPEQGAPVEPQRVPPPEQPQVIPQMATVVPGAGVKELAPGETTTDRGVRKEYQTLENSRLALLNNKTLDKEQVKQFEREVRTAKSSKDPEAVKKVLDTWETDTPEEMAALAKHAELVQPLSKGKKAAPEAAPPAAPFETTLPPPKPGVPAAFPSASEKSKGLKKPVEAAPEKMTHEELFDRLREGKPIAGLSPKQAKDLFEHHVEGKTLDEIGNARGVSREAVRQSVEKALEAVHDKVEEPLERTVRDKASEEATKKTPEFGELQSNKWKRTDRYETAMDALDKQLMEERKNAPHGELAPERLAWYVAEQTALSDEQGTGKGKGPAIRRAIARDKAAEAARAEAKPGPEPAVGHGAGSTGERGTPEPAGAAAGPEPAGGQPGPGRGLKKGSRESTWNFEERKLREQGAMTLAQHVAERGGLKLSSVEDKDTEAQYRKLIGKSMFSEATGEKVDTLVDGLVGAGVIPPVPDKESEATWLLKLLHQHHTIDSGLRGDATQAEKELAAYRRKVALAEDRIAQTEEALKPHLTLEGIAAVRNELYLGHESVQDVLDSRQFLKPEGREAVKNYAQALRERLQVLGEHPTGEAHEPVGSTAGPAEQVAPGVMFHHEPIERAGFGAPLTEEERRGGSIAGGSQEAGTLERPKILTALANAKMEEERAQRKESPLMGAARLAHQEVWDRAMKMLEDDPKAAEKLVDRLVKNPESAVTKEESALLDYQKVALRNEHERVTRLANQEYIQKTVTGHMDIEKVDRLEAQEKDLWDKMNQLDKVGQSAGTETARTLNFRKQMISEDYGLSGMLQKAAVVKGDVLNRDEKIKIEQLHDRIKKLEEKLAETEGKVRGGTAGAGDLIKARGQSEDAKGEFKKQVNDYRQQREPPSSKLFDLLKKIRINFLISGLNTLAHVSGASAARLVTTPLEQISGAVFSRIPGLAKIAAMAPRQGRGFNWKVEAKSFASFFSKGMVDAWRTVKTGKSELDSAFGKQGEPGGWANLQFRLHDALKAPAVRAEFTRSFLERMDHHARRGEDVTSPEALLRISADAYKDAQAAKFRQEHWLVDMTNNALKINPKASLPEKVAKGTGQLLLPIVRIPTNLVMETATHIFGTATGSIQAIHAYSKGLETLKPHEADAIMRQFKKGSLGVAMLALGYFKPDIFGGYYQEDEKRKKGELQPGEAQAGPVRIPSGFQHVPLMQVAQFGATIRKVEEKQVKGEKKGLGEGALAGVTGLAGDIPLIREAVDVRKMTDAHTRGAAFGELAKSFIMPQFFNWLAGQTDLQEGEHVPFGHPERRKPTGFGETLETGIPGLRQRVPLRR